MKAIHLSPPAVALLIVAVGMGYEKEDLGRLDAENLVLKQAVTEIREKQNPDAMFPKAGRSQLVKPGASGGNWNWVAVRAMMVGQMDNDLDVHLLREFQERLATMNEDELLAASEEILQLDMPAMLRQDLLNKFTSRLAEKNPELALRQLFGRTGIDQTFANAWEKWVQKDVGAASAWFDEQIAAGKTEGKRLDGSDATRTGFELKLIERLFESNRAETVVTRMEKLPRETLEHVGGAFRLSAVDEAAQKALADVYRSQLSEEESMEKLATGMRADEDNEDFSQDAAYMKRVAVTPSEAAVCLTRVMENRCVTWEDSGSMTVARIEALRTWMESQSPELTVDLTPQVIGIMARNNDQSKMSLGDVEEIVAHYQALEGGNEMLADALSRCVGPQYRREYLIALAARLPDQRQSAEILKKLEQRRYSITR